MYIFGCNYNEPAQLLHEVKACSLKINIRAYIRSDGPEKISLKKSWAVKRGGRVAPPPGSAPDCRNSQLKVDKDDLKWVTDAEKYIVIIKRIL